VGEESAELVPSFWFQGQRHTVARERRESGPAHIAEAFVAFWSVDSEQTDALFVPLEHDSHGITVFHPNNVHLE
jgi:hypothetical protein